MGHGISRYFNDSDVTDGPQQGGTPILVFGFGPCSYCLNIDLVAFIVIKVSSQQNETTAIREPRAPVSRCCLEDVQGRGMAIEYDGLVIRNDCLEKWHGQILDACSSQRGQ